MKKKERGGGGREERGERERAQWTISSMHAYPAFSPTRASDQSPFFFSSLPTLRKRGRKEEEAFPPSPLTEREREGRAIKVSYSP